MTNREWIASGATGCTFASLFAKNPTSVGWVFLTPTEWIIRIKYPDLSTSYNKELIRSIYFSETWNKDTVRQWALDNGFYLEDTSDGTVGLRIKCSEGISWVQYFGPDSHVITRQSPYPMLMYTNKLGASYYVKVGFKGILHLAHAYYDKISERVYDLLWERSYKQTKKKLGQSPDITQAAKTTFLKYKLKKS